MQPLPFSHIAVTLRNSDSCSYYKKLCYSYPAVSREVQSHLVFKKVGSPGRSFNACKHRFSCQKLSKPPYVCNGCTKRNTSCTLEKRLYQPVTAQAEYRSVLSEARTGLSLSEAEIAHLDSIVSPLLRQKQSLHNICVNHPDSIMVSESTLYRLVDYNLFQARNIDMPRKVRYVRHILTFPLHRWILLKAK